MFAEGSEHHRPWLHFCRTRTSTATNSELTDLYSWLKAYKLSLNIAKTEFMVISSRQKFLEENCGKLNIQLDNQQVSRVEHANARTMTGKIKCTARK